MSTSDAAHRQAWELLPWYVSGTLTGSDLDLVTGHLRGCGDCAGEVARCRDLAVAVRSQSAADPAPLEHRLVKLLARLDAIEAGGAASRGWRERLSEALGALRDLLQSTPPPARWALAAQGALVVLLAVGIAWQISAPSRQPYQTLASSGAGQPAERRIQIRVVFGDEMREREIRALMERIGGRIVDGPSGVDAYIVEVPAPAAGGDGVAGVLSNLRADPQVRLAEPIRSNR
jgi:hypothetical protein